MDIFLVPSHPMILLPPAEPAFGGDLPVGCDPLLPERQILAADCLNFSHGRAALIWLLRRLGPFRSALVCAYTCPVVPDTLATHGLTLGFVDVGAADWEAQARRLPAPCLVVVPALLGHAPAGDAAALAVALGDHAVVVVDAAQTAFGHDWIQLPKGGAVLSVPRKCTAMADGAVLRMVKVTETDRNSVRALPQAQVNSALKLAARTMLCSRSPATEPEILTLLDRTEHGWPDTPHRMSTHSENLLQWLDSDAHACLRWKNWQALAQSLDRHVEMIRLPGGVPFNLGILVEDRAEILARLRAQRVFATALWPGSCHDPGRHPVAADWVRRLICLPVDQRYQPADMTELSRRVIQCLPH